MVMNAIQIIQLKKSHVFLWLWMDVLLTDALRNLSSLLQVPFFHLIEAVKHWMTLTHLFIDTHSTHSN